jgi:hypothetical protein
VKTKVTTGDTEEPKFLPSITVKSWLNGHKSGCPKLVNGKVCCAGKIGGSGLHPQHADGHLTAALEHSEDRGLFLLQGPAS